MYWFDPSPLLDPEGWVDRVAETIRTNRPEDLEWIAAIKARSWEHAAKRGGVWHERIAKRWRYYEHWYDTP